MTLNLIMLEDPDRWHNLALAAHRCGTRCLSTERLLKFFIVLSLLIAVLYQQFQDTDWNRIKDAPYIITPDFSLSYEEWQYIGLTIVLIVIAIVLRKANGDCDLGSGLESEGQEAGGQEGSQAEEKA